MKRKKRGSKHSSKKEEDFSDLLDEFEKRDTIKDKIKTAHEKVKEPVKNAVKKAHEKVKKGHEVIKAKIPIKEKIEEPPEIKAKKPLEHQLKELHHIAMPTPNMPVKKELKHIETKWHHYIDEAIIIFLIIINILDFAEVLPGDMDFGKKLLSWFLLGMLLYKLSLTKLFFGEKKHHWDIILILTYFLFMLKEITSFAQVAAEEMNLTRGLFEFLAENAVLVDIITFYAGALLLIAFAVYFAFTIHVKIPSIMHVLHEEGNPAGFRKRLERFAIIFIVLIGFFVIIFNLMMEWLALAVDASLLVAAIVYYLFTAFRRHFRKLSPDSFLHKIGSAGESFYENFIELLHSSHKITLGLSGILVLHLLTDVGNFVLPYIFSFKEQVFYFGKLGLERSGFVALYLKDLATVSAIPYKIAITLIYLFNLIALLFLLIAPAYIWYKVYNQKGFKVSHTEIALFFMGIISFAITPIFKLKAIDVKSLIGTDIVLHQIKAYLPLTLAAIIIIAIGAAVFSMSYSHFLKEALLLIGLILIGAFFFIYIYYYAYTSIIYYAGIIKSVIFTKHFLIGLYFILFFILNLALYMIGTIIFLFEVKKEYRYIK